MSGFLDTLTTVSAQESPPSEKFSATSEKVRPRARVTALLLRVHPVTWPASLAVLGLLGAVVLHLFDPTEEGNFYPKCPFLLLTGLQCPGCGTTRALALLTHGDVLGAISMNLLFAIMLPVLAFLYVRWIADTLRPASKPKPFRPPPPTWTLALMVVGIIAFWIGRNLPWFSFLAAGTPLLTG